MAKYFNSWLELPKDIACNNKDFFLNKDANYNIDAPNKHDIVIYKHLKHEYNLTNIIKWYPEFNELKILRGVLKSKSINIYIYDIENIKNEWVGILHYPKFVPEMNYTSYEHLKI